MRGGGQGRKALLAQEQRPGSGRRMCGSPGAWDPGSRTLRPGPARSLGGHRPPGAPTRPGLVGNCMAGTSWVSGEEEHPHPPRPPIVGVAETSRDQEGWLSGRRDTRCRGLTPSKGKHPPAGPSWPPRAPAVPDLRPWATPFQVTSLVSSALTALWQGPGQGQAHTWALRRLLVIAGEQSTCQL